MFLSIKFFSRSNFFNHDCYLNYMSIKINSNFLFISLLSTLQIIFSECKTIGMH